MIIEIIPSGPFETNAILIVCPRTHQALIVDPAPYSTDQLLKAAQKHQAHIQAIYLTHSHWDHIADSARLQHLLKIPLYVHAEDRLNVEQPGSDKLPLAFPIEPAHVDHLLAEGQEHTLGDLKFRIIHTPGHSPGGVCLHFYDEKVLISGDTLFKGSIGNLSFPTCSSERMWASLKKLEQLPKETRVYPGHGPSTTLAAESWLPRAQQLFSR